jgi:archaellum biogenesis ATPase FlaH
MGSKLARILYEIPRELQYLSIDTILFQEEIDTPEFFRDSGLHAVDIQNQYYCPFSDEYGFDLALSLVQDLQLNTLIILEGEPASGKSTLIRLVGFQLIEKRLPVLLINPQNFSKDTVKSLMYFEEKSKVEETPDIFAILENIHLFSSDQATQLKKILKMQSKIKYLLTTRSIKDTVLEEIVQQDKEYPNTNIVGLDKDGQALNRYMQLIKLFLMKNFPSINTYEIDQVIKRIKKSTKEILSFIQLHIRLLKPKKNYFYYGIHRQILMIY